MARLQDTRGEDEESEKEGLSLDREVAGPSPMETGATRIDGDSDEESSDSDEASCWSSVASTAECSHDDTNQSAPSEASEIPTNSAVTENANSTTSDSTTASRADRRMDDEAAVTLPQADVDVAGFSQSALAPILYSNLRLRAVGCNVTAGTSPSPNSLRASMGPAGEPKRSSLPQQEAAIDGDVVNQSDCEVAIPSAATAGRKPPPSSDNGPRPATTVFMSCDDEIMFHRHWTGTPPPPPPPSNRSKDPSSARNNSYKGHRKRAYNALPLFRRARAFDGRSDPLLNQSRTELQSPTRASGVGVGGNGGATAAPVVAWATRRRKPGWWRGSRRRRAANKSASKAGTVDDSATGRAVVLAGNGYEYNEDDRGARKDAIRGRWDGNHLGSGPAAMLPRPPSFSEEDWTPLDTSYGAAIPFGGYIPKTIRRLIEHCILALFVLTLTGLVVVTSIKLRAAASSGGASGGSSSTSPSYVTTFDDDWGSNATNATSWGWNATDDYEIGDGARLRRRRH